jgi:electron transfer flavoprotein beta subunit
LIIKAAVDGGPEGCRLANVKMSLNPIDGIAAEGAIRLKEKGVASEVVVVSIGKANAQKTLRTALTMGADRTILIVAGYRVEPLGVAKLLAKVVEAGAPGLVILGKQAIDEDNNQTGQLLGALLGWGQGTFASKAKMSDEHVDVTREVDGGLETVELKLPAIHRHQQGRGRPHLPGRRHRPGRRPLQDRAETDRKVVRCGQCTMTL